MIIIEEAFLNLEPAKQLRILNAACKEFSEQGFERASTNRIVKEAGIGKGMLFYYFNSKKELYYYLVEKGIEFVLKEYLDKINLNQTDLIEKYKEAALIKMKAYSVNPYIFTFLGSLLFASDIDLPEKLLKLLEEARSKAFINLYKNIDTSLFREDIAPELIIKLIKWTSDGYEKELTANFKGQKLSEVDMSPYWESFFQYLEALKKIYYK